MPQSPTRLSAAAARRIALAAQGFGGERTASRVDRGTLRRLVDRIGLLQIDSVSTLVRAHELPAFSRLGPYRRSLIAEGAERHRDLFEYWGHAACLMPIARYPLFRWRMDRMREREGRWVDRVERERPGFLQAVLAEVRDRGAITAGQLTDGGKGSGSWWGWGDGKVALESLFSAGELTVAGRTNGFERRYDLPERVIPADVLSAPTPSIADAHRDLVRFVARALGVATRRDIFDYLYLRADRTTSAIADLVDAGDLAPVAVDGWRDQAYLAVGAAQPRRLDARALLAPFDPMVFDRDRVERLFGMRYRIELYTPAPKRVYGYYVLPFLLGDTLVARVDLKADRARETLLVQATWGEPGIDVPAVVAGLVEELRLMASWLELTAIEVVERGDLAGPLAAAVRS